MARLPINSPYTITTKFGVADSYAKFGKHSGIDYAVPLNRPVYAPTNGTLTNIKSQTGGNMVAIYDGKYYHRLMHNNSFSRSNGAVKEGEEVAKAGTTGLSTGVHVHWDITPTLYPTTFNFINPDTFLKGGSMTTRENAIWLWRTVRFKHSPTDAEKVAWTNKDLNKLLSAEYATTAFAARKEAVSKYPAVKSANIELTKAIAIKDNEIARLNAIQGNATKWEQITQLLKQILGIG